MQAHLLCCVNLTVKGKLNENLFVIFLNNMLTVKRPSGFATGQVWPRYHFFPQCLYWCLPYIYVSSSMTDIQTCSMVYKYGFQDFWNLSYFHHHFGALSVT